MERLFEDRDHSQLYSSFRPSVPETLLEKVVGFLGPGMSIFRLKYIFRESYGKPLDKSQLALDVGCGSGQATFSLTKYFEKVIGIDVSQEQIRCANEKRSEIQVNNRTKTEKK